MNEIMILLIIFSFLFLIEFKSINNLANYIGIVLSLAIIIALLFPNLTYISFILILIQISALTILFGLIIMLFPNNHTIPFLSSPTSFPRSLTPRVCEAYPHNPLNPQIKASESKEINKIKWLIGIVSIITPLFILFNYNPYNFKEIWVGDTEILKIINSVWVLEDNNTSWSNLFQDNNNNILFKIAQSFYTDSSTIIKFLFITFLLFFAIVALFFLVLPTNSI